MLAIVLLGALVLAGCGSSSKKSESSTTTVAAADLNDPVYAKPGPYKVGYTTMKLPDRTVYVWYPTDDASIGWDAFAEHGKVMFVRVNTEYDKGGRTSVKYAFKDDKPMYAKEGNQSVGWDDSGAVIVNERPGGGTVGDKDIAAIHDQAMKAFQMAQEKVDAQKKK